MLLSSSSSSSLPTACTTVANGKSNKGPGLQKRIKLYLQLTLDISKSLRSIDGDCRILSVCCGCCCWWCWWCSPFSLILGVIAKGIGVFLQDDEVSPFSFTIGMGDVFNDDWWPLRFLLVCWWWVGDECPLELRLGGGDEDLSFLMQGDFGRVRANACVWNGMFIVNTLELCDFMLGKCNDSLIQGWLRERTFLVSIGGKELQGINLELKVIQWQWSEIDRELSN